MDNQPVALLEPSRKEKKEWKRLDDKAFKNGLFLKRIRSCHRLSSRIRKLTLLPFLWLFWISAPAQDRLETALGLDKYDSIPGFRSHGTYGSVDRVNLEYKADIPRTRPPHPMPGSMYADSAAVYIFNSEKQWLRIPLAKQPLNKSNNATR